MFTFLIAKIYIYNPYIGLLGIGSGRDSCITVFHANIRGEFLY